MFRLIKELFIAVSLLGLVFCLIDLRAFAFCFDLIRYSLVDGFCSPSLGFASVVSPRALESRVITRFYFN